MARKLTELTRPSALLLLSEYRRFVRAAVALARSNPLVAIACATLGVAAVLVSVEAGGYIAPVFASSGRGVTGMTQLLLLLALLVGAVAAATSPSAGDLDDQFRVVAASKWAVAAATNVVPVLAILAVVATAASFFMYGLYAALGVEHPALWTAQFATWVIAYGAIGGACVSAAHGQHGMARAACIVAFVAIVCWAVATSRSFPWWTGFSSLFPSGPISPDRQSALADGEAFDAASPGTVALIGTSVLVGSVLAWLLLLTRLKAGPRPHGRHPGISLAGPATGAVALWLGTTLLRLRPWWRVLYVPCVGVAAGLLVRAGMPGSAQMLAPLIATALLLAFLQPPLSMSSTFDRGAWLLRSSTHHPSGTAAGWWLASAALAAVIGLAGLVPALTLMRVEMGPLVYVPVASFAVAAAGRLLPWTDDSALMQFVASLVAAVCVCAAIAFQLWVVQRIGPWSGNALAWSATALASYLVCLGLETGRAR